MALVIPPDRFESLEVKLADDSVRRAVWTGSFWWSDEKQIRPVAWRPLWSPEFAIAV